MRKRTIRQRALSLPNGSLEFPWLLVFFTDSVAALTPDHLLLSKRVSERMVYLHRVEMFVHRHLIAGPSTSHARHVMLFRTHSLRRVLTVTGWRNRYGP